MLFNHIANTANANDRQAISRLCPAGDIECHINDFHFWDWSTLSAKLSPKFITAHPNDYKWDFSVISNRDDFSAEDFRCLLDSVSSPKAEWDWDILLPLLGNQYIVDNIERLDFDLTEFTKNEIELSSALLKLHRKDGIMISFLLNMTWRISLRTSAYLIIPMIQDASTTG